MLDSMSNARALLTLGEAGDILRLSNANLRTLVKNYEIPFVVMPDGDFRFIESDLWAWIETRRMPGTEVKK